MVIVLLFRVIDLRNFSDPPLAPWFCKIRKLAKKD